MLTAPPKKTFPPGYPITEPFDDEGILTLPTPPGAVLLVIIRTGTATTGARCSYFLRRFLIKLLPVAVMPAGTNGHGSLPITHATLLYHHPAGHGLSLPLCHRASPSPTPGHTSVWLGNLCALPPPHPPACHPSPELSGR